MTECYQTVIFKFITEPEPSPRDNRGLQRGNTAQVNVRDATQHEKRPVKLMKLSVHSGVEASWGGMNVSEQSNL